MNGAAWVKNVYICVIRVLPKEAVYFNVGKEIEMTDGVPIESKTSVRTPYCLIGE